MNDKENKITEALHEVLTLEWLDGYLRGTFKDDWESMNVHNVLENIILEKKDAVKEAIEDVKNGS